MYLEKYKEDIFIYSNIYYLNNLISFKDNIVYKQSDVVLSNPSDKISRKINHSYSFYFENIWNHSELFGIIRVQFRNPIRIRILCTFSFNFPFCQKLFVGVHRFFQSLLNFTFSFHIGVSFINCDTNIINLLDN